MIKLIMKNIGVVFVNLFVVLSFAHANDLLIENVTIIDGISMSPKKDLSVLIKSGNIARIGQKIECKDIKRLDAKGGFLMSGLVDCHVHLRWGPGSYLKTDQPYTEENWETTWGKYTRHYLRAYLACGVTTIVDAGAPFFVIEKVREYLKQGSPGPRYLSLGQMIATPKGYVSDQGLVIETKEDAAEKIKMLKDFGVRGIKMNIEKGWSPFQSLPLHPPEILQAIKAEAQKCNLPVFVHVSEEEGMEKAVDMGAHALMHTFILRGDQVLSDRFIKKMAGTSTYQVSTLRTMDAELTLYELDRLNDPLLELVAPAEELKNARDYKQGVYSQKAAISFAVPWMPKFLWGVCAKVFYSRKEQEVSLKNAEKAIFDLNNAGVPIVLGTDNVYSQHVLYTFHGVSSIREMELLHEAGLSPMEVVTAGTLNGARMMNLDKEIGTVEVGKKADLIILSENPLENSHAFRSIQYTVQEGVARTPKEWMAAGI